MIRLLALRKTGLVNAICNSESRTNQSKSMTPKLIKKKGRTVDPVIDPLVHPVDVRAQRRGIEIELGLLGRDERVELGVEHADDLRRLVVHDRVPLLVPEHRHREAAGIGRVRAQVEVLHVSRVVERVRVRARELVRRGERPAVRAHAGRDDGDG